MPSDNTAKHFLSIPQIRRLWFAAFETCIFVFPIALVTVFVGRFHGALADAAVKILFLPFAVGLIGLIVWMLIYLEAEPGLTRFGLITVLAVVAFFALCIPILSSC